MSDQLGYVSHRVMQFVKDKMIPYYPLGVYKDVTAEEGAKA